MTNAISESKNSIERALPKTNVDLCDVIQVRADSGHSVRVQLRSSRGSTFGAKVLTPTSGDINIPSVGDTVAVIRAKGGLPLVIGTVYLDGGETRDYVEGQHTFGHSETSTSVTIDEDGNLTAEHYGGSKIIIRDDAVVIESDDPIHLGGESGSAVARQGDAVQVSDPESGTLSGTITGGSGQVNAE